MPVKITVESQLNFTFLLSDNIKVSCSLILMMLLIFFTSFLPTPKIPDAQVGLEPTTSCNPPLPTVSPPPPIPFYKVEKSSTNNKKYIFSQFKDLLIFILSGGKCKWQTRFGKRILFILEREKNRISYLVCLIYQKIKNKLVTIIPNC